ncbi:MAG: hypothetical protein M3Q58_00385 [Bacteroidota bacterium]|nr:hypothetical protein [Bacteroidota bacterium]
MKTLLLLLIPVSLLIFSCNSSQNTEDIEQVPVETLVNPVPEIKTEIIKSGEMDLHRTYYKNQQIRTQGNLLKEKKEGKWVSFYEDGMPWSETWYINGQKHGSTVTWHSNGKKFYEGHFEKGKESGKWTYWDEQGIVVKEVEY